MRYVVSLYKATRKDEVISDEKVVDLSTHNSADKADAQAETINVALGHEMKDGWFTPKDGDLFAMYE